MKRVLQAVALTLWLSQGMAQVDDGPHLDAIERLPIAEQHRQLSLLLLVASGAGDALVDAMLALDADGNDTAMISPDDYGTPLARIVSQESMLAGAARLLDLERRRHEAVRTRLDAIESGRPGMADLATFNALATDAIVIRTAIADSAEFSGLLDAARLQDALRSYRTRTLFLRNELEYEDFNDDLARITGEAIASVGGQLDAYQRMFDDETAAENFDRHIRAAEAIYARKGAFDARAGELTDEMIRNWVLSESQPRR